MKITNLAIIFVLIACSFMIFIDVKTNNIQAITNKEIEYKKALDTAVDDSVISLVEVDSTRNLKLNIESCVQNFYQSLYANFGIMTDKNLQEKIRAYIPVILITDEDGYYIRYSDIQSSNGEDIVTQQWTEKRPYTYTEGNLVFSFTINDYIKIYDKQTNNMWEGKYTDLASLYPNDEILNNSDRYDQVRRDTIINKITDDMNYYINQHNRIAEHYGITYTFALPDIKKSEWYRTIDDIGIFVVFQGYPYGFNSGDVFNQYSYAGSRIRKSNCYFITTEADGKKYYHKNSCTLVTNKDYPYYSKKECALEGAYPCPECNP